MSQNPKGYRDTGGSYTKPNFDRYRKPSWAKMQLLRETGLVEDVCEHGVGHPNQDWMDDRKKSHTDQDYWGRHGCDGCCAKKDENAGS